MPQIGTYTSQTYDQYASNDLLLITKNDGTTKNSTVDEYEKRLAALVRLTPVDQGIVTAVPTSVSSPGWRNVFRVNTAAGDIDMSSLGTITGIVPGMSIIFRKSSTTDANRVRFDADSISHYISEAWTSSGQQIEVVWNGSTWTLEDGRQYEPTLSVVGGLVAGSTSAAVNNATLLNAAIVAANAAGTTLYLDEGTYYIDAATWQSLGAPEVDNFALIGRGPFETVKLIRYSGTMTATRTGTQRHQCFVLAGADGKVSIENCYFEDWNSVIFVDNTYGGEMPIDRIEMRRCSIYHCNSAIETTNYTGSEGNNVKLLVGQIDNFIFVDNKVRDVYTAALVCVCRRLVNCTVRENDVEGVLASRYVPYYLTLVSGQTSPHPTVRVVGRANHGLTGLAAVDGVTLVDSDRVLLVAQSTGSENGIWEAHSGSWTRPSDYTGTLPAGNRYVQVTEGTFNNNRGSVGTKSGFPGTIWGSTQGGTITVGTTATTWDMQITTKKSGFLIWEGANYYKKEHCRLATTANHGLSGLAAIDGVTPSASDRILVTQQTSGAENGIYLAASGSWTRATDMAAGSAFNETVNTVVNGGLTNANKVFYCTNSGTVNTDASTWGSRKTFGYAHAMSRLNITLSGNQTIDGYAVTQAAGHRVLVNGQTNKAENGIYNVSTGSWTRHEQLPATATFARDTYCLVMLGDTWNSTMWRCQTTGTVATNDMEWVPTTPHEQPRSTGTQGGPGDGNGIFAWTQIHGNRIVNVHEDAGRISTGTGGWSCNGIQANGVNMQVTTNYIEDVHHHCYENCEGIYVKCRHGIVTGNTLINCGHSQGAIAIKGEPEYFEYLEQGGDPDTNEGSSGDTYGYAVTVAHNKIIATDTETYPRWGIHLLTGPSNKVIDNYIDGVSLGIYYDVSEQNTTGLGDTLICNNSIRNLRETTAVDQFGDPTTGTPYATKTDVVGVLFGASNITVRDNYIKNLTCETNAARAIQIVAPGSTYPNWRNVRIVGNTIKVIVSETGSSGILVTSGTGNVLLNSYIANNCFDGIWRQTGSYGYATTYFQTGHTGTYENNVTGAVVSNPSVYFAADPTGMIIRNNTGSSPYWTTVSGTDSIAVAASSKAVTFSSALKHTPAAKDVQLVLTSAPTNGIVAVVVSSLSTTGFTVTAYNSSGAATATSGTSLDFAYRVATKQG